MTSDREEFLNRVERERTDAAFDVAAPARDERIGPRLIPIVVAVLIGLVIIALLWLGSR
jgi:hypothetical protein